MKSFSTQIKTRESAEKARKIPNCAYAKSDADISSECYDLIQEMYDTMPTPVDFPLPSNCTTDGSPLYFDSYNIRVTDCDRALNDAFVTEFPFSKYLNLQAVQKQIHISKPQKFVSCKQISTGFYPRDPSTATKYFIGDLIDRGLEVTLYTGLLDMVVPYSGTEAAIREMTWKGYRGFKHSKMTETTMNPIVSAKSGKQVGRYHSERGMTFVVFNNAGHMVPEDDPTTAYWMVKNLVLKD
ncbi:hypothetical protein BGZ49_005419 [Haplosporangium sp. Z 27]|nr:hypothetical protein BGZ49_005419 [Haplosporangium sp. Z 27]